MFKKVINFLGVTSFIFLLISLIGFIFIDQNFFNLKDKFYSKFPNIELRKYILKIVLLCKIFTMIIMKNSYRSHNLKN